MWHLIGAFACALALTLLEVSDYEEKDGEEDDDE